MTNQRKSADLELYFLIEDDRIRDTLKQLYDNCRVLQKQIDVLEMEISDLKERINAA